MIKQDTLTFLNDIKINNNREWFHANKKMYEAAKQNIIDVTSYLTNEISKFDNDIWAFDPKKALFRIARDVRFSNDKTPYKTNFGSCISPKAKNIYDQSTYYLHIEPGKSFFTSGVYMPYKPFLNDIRRTIYYNLDVFINIVENKEFVKKFGNLVDDNDKLSRVPIGYDKDSPAAEYLKHKNYFVQISLSDEVLVDEKLFSENILSAARLMKPFNDFFNHFVKDEASG
ncbi:DUF2461 domain-containing protein [Bacteroidales bacterium OttesenSCG-928-K03]|nr:DUF2461 domain-containing protein [Odoribacter sp. OttesenSCG-928-L07]MDL2242319.1 DUF2461 domain-containing protein [Bacteroidales bacterium OttesenSCG-928-K03]